MDIESWAIDRPIPYENNPRNNAAAVALVADSLRRFGFRQPIVVDESGVVVVGHTRLLAARSIGLAEVPVHVALGLTPEQTRAYRLMDNRSSEEAEWDYDRLAVEIHALRESGGDDALLATGMNQLELERLLDASGRSNSDEWDGMPEFVQVDKTAFRSVVMHFKDQEAVDAFERAIGMKLSNRFMWYPETEIETAMDKRYESA